MPCALCEATFRFFNKCLPLGSLIEGVREARRRREPGLGFVLATALYNALCDAKEVDNLAPSRSALLDELRALACTYADDAFVREALAHGLFSTLNAAISEGDLFRRDTLLDESRALAREYPDEAAVRQSLAMG